MLLYFAAGAAFSTLAGGIMLGRGIFSSIWWIAPWALFAQVMYMGTYLAAGLF